LPSFMSWLKATTHKDLVLPHRLKVPANQAREGVLTAFVTSTGRRRPTGNEIRYNKL